MTSDGLRHRLWAITDAATLAAVAARPGRPPGADRRRAPPLRGLPTGASARHAPGAAAGPWDRGLALLVDLVTHAPAVDAIHRRGPRLGAATPDELRRSPTRRGPAGRPRCPARTAGSLLLVDAAAARPRWRRCPRRRATPRRSPGTAGATARPWQALDTACSTAVSTGLGHRRTAVTYHHDVAARSARPRRDGGLAVLLSPVDVAAVLGLAALGVRMPRKSTSFGPKPRSGLVLRDVRCGRRRARIRTREPVCAPSPTSTS